MFQFIKKIFSRRRNSKTSVVEKKTTKPVSPKKKQSSIPFNHELIDSLQAEHQSLLSSYQNIMESAEKKNYSLLLTELNEFSNLLKAHLTKEGIELYVYLELAVQGDERKIFRDFKLEMSKIASVVTSAINQYTNIPVTDKTVDQFIKEFSELGGVLVDRIEREENKLYPLYGQ